MGRIQHLDDRLISQIAAGEVVERPSSVVKELVENSIDAGATRISVELEGGGKRLIRVVDDGTGMGEEDAAIAFDRHATSKIGSFEDLQGVATLGFRGEALSSIASVGRVELVTAAHHGEGYRVCVSGGGLERSEPCPRQIGTSLEVADLFYNVPARRNFLKNRAAELRRCVEVVQGYCLAQRGVSFELRHEGKVLLDTPAAGEGPEGLKSRIGRIFTAALEEHLVEIGPRDLRGEGRVYGFVGDRDSARGRRFFVFVNDRLVRDRALLAIFYRVVRSEWGGDRFPPLFLFLEIDPQLVDVNVHPQKAEVRFRDNAFLGGVSRALSSALASARGEEAAAAVPLGVGEAVPQLGWEGGGGAYPGIREPTVHSAYSPKLAQVSYQPPRSRPVPLSGRREPAVGALRLLGQYKGTLLLLEGPDGLYLIDQHVAHERILYERFRAALEEKSPPSQALLAPVLLELSRAEAARLLEGREALAAAGFAFDQMSGGTVALRSHPAVLDSTQSVELLMTFLEQIAETGSAETSDPRERMLDALAASQSCRAAVKMHHPLGVEEMEVLVSELFEAEQPYACPHGRPIVLRLTDADLEKRFKRR